MDTIKLQMFCPQCIIYYVHAEAFLHEWKCLKEMETLFVLQIFSFMLAVKFLVTFHKQNYPFQGDTEMYWSDISSCILVNWKGGLKEVTCFDDAVSISWPHHDNVDVMILFIFSDGKTTRTAASSEVWMVSVELA